MQKRGFFRPKFEFIEEFLKIVDVENDKILKYELKGLLKSKQR